MVPRRRPAAHPARERAGVRAVRLLRRYGRPAGPGGGGGDRVVDRRGGAHMGHRIRTRTDGRLEVHGAHEGTTPGLSPTPALLRVLALRRVTRGAGPEVLGVHLAQVRGYWRDILAQARVQATAHAVEDAVAGANAELIVRSFSERYRKRGHRR